MKDRSNLKNKLPIILNNKNAFSIKKRLLDYSVSLFLIILLLPIMMIIVIIIKILSPNGSPIFMQCREGLNGKEIKIIKFRTMHIDSHKRLEIFLKSNPIQAQYWYQFYNLDPKIDPRLIPFGNFLRKSSIDELPNLWNVIRGDMSLVGPRPFPYYHLESYDAQFRALRASVWPGITGLWQLQRGDAQTQKRLDTEYIKNWSFSSDIKILLKTIPIVLLSKKTIY